MAAGCLWEGADKGKHHFLRFLAQILENCDISGGSRVQNTWFGESLAIYWNFSPKSEIFR